MSKPLERGRVALLTGATGFVGGHLARHLAQSGWRVHALVRPRSRLPESLSGHVVWHRHEGDVAGLATLLEAERPDVVFHLASLFLSQHKPEDVDALIASNVLLGARLLEAMDRAGVGALVNTGSSWQNHENAEYNPVNLYAASKQAFEDIARYYTEARGLRMITLRLSDTYGPDDPRPKLIKLLIDALRKGEPLRMSPGAQLIDLVHIDDVVEAFRMAGERVTGLAPGAGEVYSVRSDAPLSLRDLVGVLARVAGRASPVEWGARPYRPREVMLPPTRLATLPGWRAKVALEAGLARQLALTD